MNNSRRPFLYISIVAILIYWLYVFFIKANAPAKLPTDFNSFILSVTIQKIVTFLIVLILLKLEGENLVQLGFKKEGLIKQILYGLLFGTAIWIFIHVIFNPALSMIYPLQTKHGPDMSIFMKDIKNLLIWIPIAILGGGFVEEIQRIFVLTRFQKWLGENGLYAGLLISSIAFGIGHLYQGVNTAIGTGVVGLLNGLVYLRKRSAAEAISCHAFFDLTSILIGYSLNNS